VERKQILLRKYFHKQCSREELEELFGYLQHDSEEQYQEVIWELWHTLYSALPISTTESEEIYAQMQEKMDSHTSSRFRLSPGVWRIAATFTGLLMIASFFIIYFLKTEGVTTHTTDYGKITTIELPDASTVVLNGNSTLRYQDHWEEGALREVWVEGEAYFSVRHLEGDTKFKVHTQNLTIEVLGTEFNVTNRRGNTQVTLNTGSIRLNAPPKVSGEVVDIIMKPGEQALFTKDQEFELKVVNPELYTSWKDHELLFENAPLWQVGRIIEDTYGVTVHFKDYSLRTIKITGSLPNDKLEVLTGMLSEILNVQITQEKDRIYIDKR
jgi:transmembrane sensor